MTETPSETAITPTVPEAARVFRIAVLPGDGVGPEVIAQAIGVLEAVAGKLDGIELQFTDHPEEDRSQLDRCTQ